MAPGRIVGSGLRSHYNLRFLWLLAFCLKAASNFVQAGGGSGATLLLVLGISAICVVFASMPASRARQLTILAIGLTVAGMLYVSASPSPESIRALEQFLWQFDLLAGVVGFLVWPVGDTQPSKLEIEGSKQFGNHLP